MKRLAFTLLELLAVIAIIATLATLLFPMFQQAKEAAKKSQCVSNLHQIFLQTTLYRSDWNGENSFGDIYSMGLPPPTQVTSALPSYVQLRCPDGLHPLDKTLGDGYFMYFGAPGHDGEKPSWADYAGRFEDAAVLYADPFHNSPDTTLMFGDHLSRFLQGVALGGNLVKRTQKGDWQNRLWWTK